MMAEQRSSSPLPAAADPDQPASHASSPSLPPKRDLSTTAPHSSRSAGLARNQLPASAGLPSGVQSLAVSRSPSLAASPRSSRDSSPAGPSFRLPQNSNASRGMRSRKNSHEVSPQRGPNVNTNTLPSAAAIQRALSRETAPQLQPTATSDPNSRIPRSQKVNGVTEERERPSWPVSPRLKSPPPNGNARRNPSRSQRLPTENGGIGPDIIVQRSSPDLPPQHTNGNIDKANNRAASSNISTLETVQESSGPATPADSGIMMKSVVERKPEYSSNTSDEDRPATALHDSEGSFSGGTHTPDAPTRSSAKRRTASEVSVEDLEATPRPKLSAKESLSKLNDKTAAEPVSRNMTVETETVNSVAQASLGVAADRVASGRVDPNGPLRVKASTETIRPKKERKKNTRKTPSANAASSSSTRADIFEDRVKNAMDEATSDDSDETFVYESNPPEHQPRRNKHHSRTPSGASLSSMADRGIMRSIANVFSDQQRSVPKSRSMKFASNNSNYGTADEEGENRDGTIRARDRSRSNAVNQHFSGQRNVTGQSVPPEEENIVPLSKTKSLTAVGGRGSYAARLAAQSLRHTSTVRKSDGYASLDIDAEGADDERAPLMGSVRTPRSNRTTRRYRYVNNQPPTPRHSRSILARLAGCLLILVTVSLLTFGVVCFLFAFSKPLMDVTVTKIDSVIASEQELMLDITVSAVNPNLVPITITDLDVNLFARSKYVGSEKWWREHGPQPEEPDPEDGDQKKKKKLKLSHKRDPIRRRESLVSARGTHNIIISDPPVPQDPSAGQTMLLGPISHFDNPLVFDGSFWKRRPHLSTGSIRLSKPGNHTEAGGTERWERVLKHDFDLIVRGVLRYNIPLGGKATSVPISGETQVDGNGGGKDDKDDDDDAGDPFFDWPGDDTA